MNIRTSAVCEHQVKRGHGIDWEDVEIVSQEWAECRRKVAKGERSPFNLQQRLLQLSNQLHDDVDASSFM